MLKFADFHLYSSEKAKININLSENVDIKAVHDRVSYEIKARNSGFVRNAILDNS